MTANHVRHPGPPSPNRLESHLGRATSLTITLEPGLSLNEAIARPLQRAGLTAAAVKLEKIRFQPFRYVIPAFAPDDTHAAYYSDTFAPAAETEIEIATLTWGHRADGPFLHCHALWRDAAGTTLEGGHLLPFEAIVSQSGQAEVFGTADVAMASEYDPETNFTLFGPKPLVAQPDGACLVARIRPNQDLTESIEHLCATNGISHAIIRSGIGSTIGMTFDDGRVIPERPTELVTLTGRIAPDATGRPIVDLVLGVIDVHGRIHQGTPARGRNPVLICFELLIERLPPP